MISVRDLRRLRWPILAALAMAGAGSLVLWHVTRSHESAVQAQREAEGQLRAITQRYREAMRNEDDMRAIRARYEALDASKALGPERRLDWIEALRRIRDTLRIPALEYEIRPQRPLAPGDEGSPRLMASSMSLELRLRHEGELVALFDALEKAPSAIVVPRGCTVDRLPTEAAPDGPALRASCEIDWVTVLPKTPATSREGA